MMRLFLAAVMILVPTLAHGQCRTTFVRHAPFVHHAPIIQKEVIVQKEIVATFVPLVVQIPTYSVTYAPGHAPQAAYVPAAPVAQACPPAPQGQGHQVMAFEQRLLVLLEKLDAKLGGNGAPPPQTAANPAHKVYLAKCAMCHEASVAPAKGKNFVMMEGNQIVKFTDTQAKKIMIKTFKGEMPPPAENIKLTDEEYGAIMADMDTVK